MEHRNQISHTLLLDACRLAVVCENKTVGGGVVIAYLCLVPAAALLHLNILVVRLLCRS